MKMTVFFRVQAGPQTGLGHLWRSLSLAQALERHGVSSHFLLHPDPRGKELVDRVGFRAELWGGTDPFGEEDARETLGLAKAKAATAVVVDYHDIPVSYIQRLRRGGLFTAVRDDLALRALPADLVINGNADAQGLGYERWGGGTQFLVGPRYAMLSKEYEDPAPRVISRQVRRILVVLGGGDSQGWMSPLLDRLDRVPGDFELSAMLGPFFQGGDEIRETAGRLKRRVRLITAQDSLTPWIAQADAAVSAAGQTLYELAALGCPTVAVQAADNQSGQMRALERAGTLRGAGRAGEPGWLDRVERELTELIREASLREEMARAGQKLVDGAGADRVARGLLETIGAPLTLKGMQE